MMIDTKLYIILSHVIAYLRHKDYCRAESAKKILRRSFDTSLLMSSKVEA